MSDALREGAIWFLVWILPAGIASFVVYLFLTIPPRRLEQSRLFLDILETGLRRGDSPERTIVSVSGTRERSLGARFHLMAAYIEEGLSFGAALEITRGFLPQTVCEMVKLGARENVLEKILPAARGVLEEGSSRLRAGLNYVVLIFFVLGPTAIVLQSGALFKIGAKLQWIYTDVFDGTIPPPKLPMLVFGNVWAAAGAQALLLSAAVIFGVLYIWNEGALRFGRKLFGSLPDRFLLLLPWKRRRAQRDFTGLLALLLDAGINELDALKFAGQATGNRLLQIRAQEASHRVASGVALPQALDAMKVGREFHWRWANALRGGKDFFTALRGWHEWLNAKAFQQEQAAAHVMTSALVLVNGAIVMLLTAALFQLIAGLVEQEALW